MHRSATSTNLMFLEYLKTKIKINLRCFLIKSLHFVGKTKFCEDWMTYKNTVPDKTIRFTSPQITCHALLLSRLKIVPRAGDKLILE